MCRLRAVMMQTSKGAMAPVAPSPKLKTESGGNRGLAILQAGQNVLMPIPLPRRRTSENHESLIRKAGKKVARFIPSVIIAAKEEEKEEVQYNGSSRSEYEPSTACLAEMVQDFLQEEDKDEEEEVKVGSCGRARCNCLNGTRNGASQGLLEEEDEDEEVQGGVKKKNRERRGGHSHRTEEEEEEEEEEEDEDDDNDDDEAWIQSFLGGNACEILEGVTSCTGPFELRLLADVAAALQAAKPADVSPTLATWNSRSKLRSIMWHLRGAGYNAAVCKSQWNPGVGFPAGEYEYINVIVTAEMGRGVEERSDVDRTSWYIVDIEFQAQFEIARPSRHYRGLLALLPRTFVGRPGRLKQVVSIMADAAKRSFRRSGMRVPPWRRQGYMLAKWMSLYKRTANLGPLASPPLLPSPSVAVKGPQVPPSFLLQINELEPQKRTKKPHDAVLQRPSVLTVVCGSWQLPVLIDRQPATKEQVASGLAYALSQHNHIDDHPA